MKRLTGELTRFDTDKQDIIRNAYLEIAEKNEERIIIIDAEKSKDIIFSRIIDVLNERFSLFQ